MRIDTVLHIPPQILYHLTERNAVTLSRRKLICLQPVSNYTLCLTPFASTYLLVLSVAALMFS